MSCRVVCRTLLVGLSIGAAFFAGLYFPKLTQWQGKESGAEATLLILRNEQVPDVAGRNVRGGEGDFVAAQIAILRSPFLVDRAIKVGNLDTLKSLEKEADKAATIRRNLSVNQDLTGKSVLALHVRGEDEADSTKILEAIIAAYQDFVAMNDFAQRTAALNSHKDAVKAIKRELNEAEKAYEKLRQEAVIWGPADQVDFLIDQIKSLRHRKAEMMFAKDDAQTKLARINAEPDDVVAALHLREWGNKVGYDALPEEIRKKSDLRTAYRAYLEDSIKHTTDILQTIDRDEAQKNLELRERQNAATKEKLLVANIRRTESLFDATVQRMTALNAAQQNDRMEIKVLSPARAVSGS